MKNRKKFVEEKNFVATEKKFVDEKNFVVVKKNFVDRKKILLNKKNLLLKKKSLGLKKISCGSRKKLLIEKILLKKLLWFLTKVGGPKKSFAVVENFGGVGGVPNFVPGGGPKTQFSMK